MTLDEIKINETAIIKDIKLNANTKRRILDFGLIKGTKIIPILKNITGDSRAYKARGCLIAIRNEDAIKDKIDFGNTPEWIRQVGYDPQTSGGLLCSIDASDAEKALDELSKLDIRSSIVGEVIEKKEKAIYMI